MSSMSGVVSGREEQLCAGRIKGKSFEKFPRRGINFGRAKHEFEIYAANRFKSVTCPVLADWR